VDFVHLATFGSGGLVGSILGLVGGGGSVLAVPLLVYGVGVSSAHVAIGTSALAVSVSALTNLGSHARAGNVKWACAGVFTLAGVVGAALGSSVAKLVDGHRLLALFGVMMVVIGLVMLRAPKRPDVADVRLSRATARRLAPRLIAFGLGVGALSGFFGIGGGVLGGLVGVAMGRRLSRGRDTLRVVFALFVVAVGVYVVARGAASMFSPS
jgi:uncharacterized membrane protein YfcA